MITVEIPLVADEVTGNIGPRHIDGQLTDRQALMMRWMLKAMRGREMDNGRFVDKVPDVVRYLLDRIYHALPDELKEQAAKVV